MPARNNTLVAAGALLVGAMLTPAQAGADEWKFSVSPYLWLPGLKGDIVAVPGRPPVSIEADFGDLLDRLTGVFMVKGEVSNGRLSFLADFDYVGVEDAEELVVDGVVPAGADMEANTLNGTLAVAARVYDGERFDLDLVGGARYTSVELDVTAQIGAFQFTGGQNEDWWDPILGVRGELDLGGRSSLSFYGDYGGATSDEVWQVFGGYAYQINRSAQLTLGYRHYVVDFDRENFAYDVELGGPVIGARFGF